MNWWTAKQSRISIPENATVADLIELLKKCPQDYPVCNADEGSLCEICVATDSRDKQVQIYQVYNQNKNFYIIDVTNNKRG